MAVTRVIRLGVGAVLATGVIAAGWYVAMLPGEDTPPIPTVAPGPQAFDGNGARVRPLPPNPTGVSLAMLPLLQPGMSRAEVEDVVGLPDPAQVQPVGGAGGRATYHTAYPIDLPGGGGPRPPVGVGPLCFVAFEFDATLPGHPLINVLYPDPLF